MNPKNQKINCTVGSCTYNDEEERICNLEQIIVEPCVDCNNGRASDECMCGSYECKCNEQKEQ